MVTLLDGPLGTELSRLGHDTSAPLWSARALAAAPAAVRALHAAYAQAGARVHTANTFRTQPGVAGADWQVLLARAVSLCREAVGATGGRVAGSMAPIADCYRPDLSPPQPRAAHRAMARALAGAGCDLLLVETFPHAGEARVAVEEAAATGLPVWVALTAGPDADLLTPGQLAAGAREAVAAGARAALVNCVPAARTLPYVRALADLGVPFGAYANAGHPTEGLGWSTPDVKDAARRYADLAAEWVDAGATLVGSCCGTGPATVAALARRFCPDPP